MKPICRFALLVALLAAVLAPAPLPAAAAPDSTTHHVQATAKGWLTGGVALPDSISSSDSLYFKLDLQGGGLLQGTAFGYAQPLADGYAGVPDQEVVPLAGALAFVTNHGTASCSLSGLLNVTTGEVTLELVVVLGTEKLEGAAGTLSFCGVDSPLGGSPVFDPDEDESFTGDITGDITLPK